MKPKNWDGSFERKENFSCNSDDRKKLPWHDTMCNVDKEIGGLDIEVINFEELRYFTDLVDSDIKKSNRNRSISDGQA